jgi:hypothetical protein
MHLHILSLNAKQINVLFSAMIINISLASFPTQLNALKLLLFLLFNLTTTSQVKYSPLFYISDLSTENINTFEIALNY